MPLAATSGMAGGPQQVIWSFGQKKKAIFFVRKERVTLKMGHLVIRESTASECVSHSL